MTMLATVDETEVVAERRRSGKAGNLDWGNPVIYVVALLFVAAMLSPVLYVVVGGFRSNAQITTDPSGWPHPWQGDNYWTVLTNATFWRAFLNSTIAAVLTTMEKGDKAEVTGLRGNWNQIHLEKKIVGYIHPAPAATTAPLAATPAAGGDALLPPSGGAIASGGTGKPAPSANAGDGGSSALPRLFQGKLVSTRRPFAPRRPYDYQLNDDSGARFAYLDVSKLLQTDQISKYADRTVVIYGTARNDPEAKGIVIEVESLELK